MGGLGGGGNLPTGAIKGCGSGLAGTRALAPRSQGAESVHMCPRADRGHPAGDAWGRGTRKLFDHPAASSKYVAHLVA